MDIAKNIELSGKILFRHKLRTLLSLLGIIAGVSAVIIMVAVGEGTEQKVISQISNMGSNLLIVSSGQVKVIAGRPRTTKSVTTLELKDSDAIATLADVLSSVPSQDKMLPVKYESLSTKTKVTGTMPEIFELRNFSLSDGRFFSEEENKGAYRVAVIGQKVVENIMSHEDPMGKIIRIKKVPFEIIGVLNAKGLDMYGQDEDDQIFIPVNTALRRLFNLDYINSIFVQIHDEEAMADAEFEIKELLRQNHRLRGNQQDDFTVLNQTEIIKTQREASKTFTLLIGSVAFISLLVGGIGILAVMLISIRERIKEIGIRRAIGAKREDILLQFLGESLILSIVGGMIGIGLGVASALAISRLAGWNPIISTIALVVSFASSIIIGIFAGVYPAIKAAFLDPIKALQFE
jgi:putative ABC transport system permease protein